MKTQLCFLSGYHWPRFTSSTSPRHGTLSGLFKLNTLAWGMAEFPTNVAISNCKRFILREFCTLNFSTVLWRLVWILEKQLFFLILISNPQKLFFNCFKAIQFNAKLFIVWYNMLLDWIGSQLFVMNNIYMHVCNKFRVLTGCCTWDRPLDGSHATWTKLNCLLLMNLCPAMHYVSVEAVPRQLALRNMDTCLYP